VKSKRRQKTLKNCIDGKSSILHIGQKVDFIKLAGVPEVGAIVTSIQTRGRDVIVKWREFEYE